jgi:type III secretion system-like peptide-binding chaperone
LSDAIKRKVQAILENNGFRWSEQDGGYTMRFASTALRLGFTTMGHQTVIALRAPVLRDIPTASGFTPLLTRLNELNCISHFGKWSFYASERLVVLEYDLLGDHLQENELMTALTTLARLADQQDDLLQREFGDLRSFEA